VKRWGNPGGVFVEIVGLSISRCVKAILEHQIPVSWISKIVAGTSCQNLDEIWDVYSTKEWSRFPIQSRKIFSQLIEEGKIDQPRLRDQSPPDTSRGIWIVGSCQVPTEELLEIIKTNDFFLRAAPEDRAAFFRAIPGSELKKQLAKFPHPVFQHMFPGGKNFDLASLAEETMSALAERLVSMYQAAPAARDASLHSHVILAFGPLIRQKMMRLKASNFFEVAKNPNISKCS